MKKILVTGGAGFIGTNLVNKLLRKNYSVTVLDNLSDQIHGDHTNIYFNSIKDKINFIRGDVRSKADWLKALKSNQIVVHLAAETGTGQSMYAIEKKIETNVRGTRI